MPKYKVTYVFEIEVESPNMSLAGVNADYIFDHESDYYLWDFCVDKEIVEMEEMINAKNGKWN